MEHDGGNERRESGHARPHPLAEGEQSAPHHREDDQSDRRHRQGLAENGNRAVQKRASHSIRSYRARRDRPRRAPPVGAG